MNRLEEKGSDCPSQTIAEEVLQTGVIIAINQTITGCDGFTTILAKNIETVLGAEFDMDTDDIDVKLSTLQDEIMRLASSKSDYDSIAAEIHRLRSIKQETQEHKLTPKFFQFTAISSTHPIRKVSIDINYVISPHVECVALISPSVV